MDERIGVYAGSFDLLTNGHLWMIQQGSRLFDRLIVAVANNPDKNCMFSFADRSQMISKCLKEMEIDAEIRVIEKQFLVDFAKEHYANYLLRGIRSANDYEAERIMRNINADLSSGITSLFLFPPRELAEISSSIVKGMIGLVNWQEAISPYVPKPVLDVLKEKI